MIEIVHEYGKVNVGKVLTRFSKDNRRRVDVYSKDDEGINNVAIITDKAGMIGVTHEVPFTLKSNLRARESYNDRVDRWLVRNRVL